MRRGILHHGLACAAMLGASAVLASQSPPTGIAAKRPVLAAACKVCPWGAVAEVVRQMMAPLGYDAQICYNCWRADNPRLVAGRGLPPRVVLPSYIAASDVPAPPSAPIDFGVTSVQNVYNAYHGRGGFVSDGPRRNLRLIASIQAPSYLIVGVQASLGIADLGELRAKRWPVRLLAGSGDVDAVLAHYGLSREAIEQAGGHVGNASVPEERARFDVVIANGSLGNAPEYNVWYEVSQKHDLTYLQLPPALLEKLDADPTVQRGRIPNGLLRGIHSPIETVVRTGIMVYGRDDLPEAFAYDVARAIDERQELLQWAPLNFSYNHRTVWKALDIPLHAGAARYYREQRYMP